MKTVVTSSLILILAMAGFAKADIYTLQPPPSPNHDLWDLDHSQYYAWKITPGELNLSSNEVIIGASLLFDNIRNWNSQPNTLYISLLAGDDLSFAGNIFIGTDNEAYGDDVLAEFAGLPMVTFEDYFLQPHKI